MLFAMIHLVCQSAALAWHDWLSCFHVGAILHWVEAAVSIQKNVACTSKENKWIMPTPKEIILYLELREINFKAPKHLKLKLSSPCRFISSSVSECKIVPPSEYERDDFYMRLPKRGKGSH